LGSSKNVMDELCLPEDSPALTQQLIAAALKRSDEWLGTSPAAALDFVRKVVRRVVVHPGRIEVEASKRRLRAALAAEHLDSLPRPVNQQQEEDSDDVIRLEVEARIKRCRGERLVVTTDSQVRSHPISSLLKAVARGRQWYDWILAGEVSGRRSIAQKLALDERYAPDIVEAILDGRQPSDLTFEKLTRGLPLSWVEQREQLGFPPRRSST